jgi:two-component system, sensor histidine kinase and response regulator
VRLSDARAAGVTDRTGDDVIDADALDRLERIGGPTLVARMAALWIENAALRVAAARDAAAAGALDDARRAAHSLKSTAANVGAHVVQSLAARTEAAAAAGDSPTVAALVEEIGPAFNAARNRLHALTTDAS